MAAATAASAQTEEAKKETRLEEYTAPSHAIDTVDIDFDLAEENTRVTTVQRVRSRDASSVLELDGSPDIELKQLTVDGKSHTSYERTKLGGLRLQDLPANTTFDLRTVVTINPKANLALEGLYISDGNFTTQMEAQGFRNVTFHLDRPDVLSRWTCTVRADKQSCPVLLSNGNLTDSRDCGDGRHQATYVDPFPKPCYLFALVAGDLAETKATYTRGSGKDVDIRIFTEYADRHKVDWHIECLKNAMRWDEQVYGNEYDLDEYKTVCVNSFQAGAMENKGLVIFNSKRALATPETATDAEFASIEGVVGHEYFHTWTGNRITLRDWFHLSFKEGLTVFRERHFCGDMNSHAIQRIEDVKTLRRAQFPEDAGPSAHPVRPKAFVTPESYFDATVYLKGAEVISILWNVLGGEGFMKGFQLYKSRHDGDAIASEDWIKAHEDANGVDLSQFVRWYDQAGTPTVTFRGSYDPKTKEYTLTVSQYTPPTPGEPQKNPLLIPLNVGLLASDGSDLPLQLKGESSSSDLPTTKMINLSESEASYTFVNVAEEPTISAMRNFSAPVRVDSGLSKKQRAFLLAHDSDPFNRWDAGQALFTNLLIELYNAHKEGKNMELDPLIVDSLRKVLEKSLEEGADKAFFAKVLDIPAVGEVVEEIEEANPIYVYEARRFARSSLATELKDLLWKVVHQNDEKEYNSSKEGRAKRAMKNAALGLLAETRDANIAMDLLERCKSANNMTDRLGALSCLNDWECNEREEAHSFFKEKYKDDEFVRTSWLGLQGNANISNNLANVQAVMNTDLFDMSVPNHVFSLIGGFASSALNFHADDGSGYRFVTDKLLELDQFNPSAAARMVKRLVNYKNFDKYRQSLMLEQLRRMYNNQSLSANAFELVSKALAQE